MRASYVDLQYRAKDVPWYPPGHAATLSLIDVGLASAIGMRLLLHRENSCRDCGERNEVIGDSKRGDLKDNCYESVEAVKKEEGDGWSGCRYIISDHSNRRNIAISDMIYLSTLDTRTLNGHQRGYTLQTV